MRNNSASEGKLFSDISPFDFGLFLAALGGATGAAGSTFATGFAGAALTGVAGLTAAAFAVGKVTADEAFVAGVFFEGMEALVGVEVLTGTEALEGDAVLAGALALADVTVLDEVVVLAETNVLAVTTGLDLTGAAFLTAAAFVATDFDALVAFVAMRSLHKIRLCHDHAELRLCKTLLKTLGEDLLGQLASDKNHFCIFLFTCKPWFAWLCTHHHVHALK
jgi:hypothetical protein